MGEFFAANYFVEDLERDVLAKRPHSRENLCELAKTKLYDLRRDYEAYERATAFFSGQEGVRGQKDWDSAGSA